MLKAVAIDDEPIALEVIRNFAEQIAFLEVTGYFTNPLTAMDYLRTNKVDLLFLDIKMPDISGIDFVKSLSNPPLVIFTTAYSEHAVQSFELDVIDYLLKPFSFSRFLKACNKSYSHHALKNGDHNASPPLSIFIKSGYEQVRIDLNTLLFAESKGNYVQFVTENQKIISRLSMGEAEKYLPAAFFMRIHRSYIVAKRKITKVEKRSVWIGTIELPVGPDYSNQLQKFIKSV